MARAISRDLAQEVADALKAEPAITVCKLAAGFELAGLDARDLVTELRAAGLVERDGRDSLEDVDPSLWGDDAPAGEELHADTRRTQAAREEALRSVLRGAPTREQAAGRLGITPQAVSERRKTGRLIALRRGREWRFPAWQFGDGDALPGLERLAGAYPGTPLNLSVWAVRPSPDLGGRTPAQELARRGGVDRVLELVGAIRAAAW